MSENAPLTLRANSFFVSFGGIIRLGVSLLSVPLLVRFLGLDRYGVWVVLNSVISFSGLMEFGVSTALTYYLSENFARQDWPNANRILLTSLILITCLGGLTSVGLWLAHPLISQTLFVENSVQIEASLGLGLLSWLLLFRFWQQWAMAIEASFLRYDIQASIETVSAFTLQMGIMLLALAGNSLWVLALWSLFVTFGSVGVHFLVLRRLFTGRSLQLNFSGYFAEALLRFGAKQWLASLGSSLFGYADRIIVNLFLGTAAAGLYSAATSIAIQINTLSAIPLRVLPPEISAAKASFQYARIRHIFIRATRLNGLLVLLTVAPILFWAPQVSALLVGSEHAAQVTQILRILAGAYGLYSLSADGFFSAIGLGLPGINARWGVIGALFSLFAIAILAYRAGLSGAAIGNFGYAVVLIINFRIANIIEIGFKSYIKIFYPSILMIFMWWLLSIYFNIEGLPFWALILLFGLLLIPSIIFVSGSTLCMDILNMILGFYNKGIFFLKGLVNDNKKY